MTIDDFDAVECNEAFASIALMWPRAFSADPESLQPAGRCHRHRTSAGGQRRAADDDAAQPARGHRRPLRVPDHVRGRGTGQRHGHRAAGLITHGLHLQHRAGGLPPGREGHSGRQGGRRLRASHDRRPGGCDRRAVVDHGRAGWLGVLVPESAGGLGLGLVDVVVLQEELGQLPFPGPFVSSAVAATVAAVHLGVDQVLADLASGARRGTVAVEEPGHGDPLATVGATADPDGEHWLLSGPSRSYSTGPRPTGRSWWRTTVPGWAPSSSRARPASRCRGWTSPASWPASCSTAGGPGGWGRPATTPRPLASGARRHRRGPVAELVGTSERALQLAVEYAQVRVQFDRPIATFQAIKHKAAEMLQHLELARVGTHFAAGPRTPSTPTVNGLRPCARATSGEAADAVTAECIQIHGGVGFTWDVDCHLLYRRAKQDDLLFGAQGYQRQRLASLCSTDERVGQEGRAEISTSLDHNSLWAASGRSSLGLVSTRCPWAKAGDDTHASKACWSRQRVTTSHVWRSSVGAGARIPRTPGRGPLLPPARRSGGPAPGTASLGHGDGVDVG